MGVAIEAISSATLAEGNEVRVFGLSSDDWVAGDGACWTGAPATMFKPAAWSGPFGYAPAMLSALRAFDADVVHLHGLWTYPSIAGYLGAYRMGAALVVSAHGMLSSVSLKYSGSRKRLARLLFQDKILRAADILHATSSSEKTSFLALGLRSRIVSIPLGMDVIARPEVARGERRRLLFLGRLHHQKGIDWLVDAWLRLEADFGDWELAIVGPQELSYAHEIERLKQATTGKRVNFVGPLYGEQKVRFLAASELLAMPSRSENFGLTAAEAMMMEVPVIATEGTPWSGLADAAAGWWIKPGAEALEQALRAAMRLPEAELHRMGRNGRQWIKRDFSWPVIGDKWQGVYESLVHTGGR
ncbi:glycosyltransferase [Vulcanococcus limneticus Candia 3F8]|uniref:glycosyltransferase n=1 Tax=Vulcanococcus limneticus TaxID=2170428 RepID=UPI0018E3A007|nr:glycosyltransferase [Vulcanococcus limneticus]MCP9791139.1 glycosyltransferase [Vulcanococcus limneticus MW73D5]MCP9893711.1 glycosyltransferase [Vulcanococcus limneticus Candia 3F8]MCP9896537.1 glycosyltransferase [Vulcanococcus limneticus Candia 3B3]